ncbi:MAG: hypothetical protein ACFB0B_08010 [Thermonemataceae bacterium]
MDEHYKTNFESAWQKAFEKAEEPPADTLWDKLDAHLTQERESAAYRRKLLLYKYIAIASSFLVLVCVSIIFSIYPHQEQPIDLAQVEALEDNNEVIELPTTVEPTAREAIQLELDQENTNIVAVINYRPTDIRKYIEAKPIAIPTKNDASLPPDFTELSKKEAQFAHTPLQSLYRSHLDSSLLGIEDVLAQSAPTENNNKNSRGIQVGVNFAPMAFNPNFQVSTSNISTPVLSNQGTRVVDASTEINNELENNVTPAFSYQTGLQIGTKISNRVLLQTGFTYGQYTSAIETNNFIYTSGNERTPSFFSLIDENHNRSIQLSQTSSNFTARESDYTSPSAVVYNTYSYLGIPIKIGYQLQHNRWGYTLSTGISPHFLLRNILSSSEANISTLDIGTDDASIYRNVYVNGLLAFEINYQLLEKCGIAIEPIYQQALMSSTRNNMAVQSTPQAFGVNLGARYIF